MFVTGIYNGKKSNIFYSFEKFRYSSCKTEVVKGMQYLTYLLNYLHTCNKAINDSPPTNTVSCCLNLAKTWCQMLEAKCLPSGMSNLQCCFGQRMMLSLTSLIVKTKGTLPWLWIPLYCYEKGSFWHWSNTILKVNNMFL